MSPLSWKKLKDQRKLIGFWLKNKVKEQILRTRMSDTRWDLAISLCRGFWNQRFTEIEPAGYKLLSKVKILNIDSEPWICFLWRTIWKPEIAEKNFTTWNLNIVVFT